ncbi:ribosome biogenesis GTP-binding protein YihA/YsxC [Brevibacillus humidisoli]|uniref:ribosome biogenesis GTP-binding protein YihA/YsxC n=1 Tax=Brevibacillus humidisoli TaxID=2895522 RepID=UPI001E3A0665|nr:ribosome biogenesis GTP-binding protein YihA/YsxC [Brevibacillus humidisoli]UFJ39087.1 ribosome biogenesis GTP-binding protein YihA/YsxC [Brevibacillus humidisoli]
MKVLSAEFVISAVAPKQYPTDGLPEVALVGRSNVGKSSLINKMLNRKSLARTSSRPGKTQTLNYFRINGELYFVDFPGYGYAKVSKSIKSQWGKMIETYLTGREELKLVIQLVDIRHPPSKDDIAMYDWCKQIGLPTVIVATKGDKIARGRWLQHTKVIRQDLRLRGDDTIIIFSAETGQGRDELWSEINRRLFREEEA